MLIDDCRYTSACPDYLADVTYSQWRAYAPLLKMYGQCASMPNYWRVTALYQCLMRHSWDDNLRHGRSMNWCWCLLVVLFTTLRLYIRRAVYGSYWWKADGFRNLMLICSSENNTAHMKSPPSKIAAANAVFNYYHAPASMLQWKMAAEEICHILVWFLAIEPINGAQLLSVKPPAAQKVRQAAKRHYPSRRREHVIWLEGQRLIVAAMFIGSTHNYRWKLSKK